MLKLKPMCSEEFHEFSLGTITRYAEQLSTSPNSLIKSRSYFQSLLPNGQATEGHHFYSINTDEEHNPAGFLWFHIDFIKKTLFIYDIYILLPFRRQGLATQTLRNIFGQAKVLDIKKISLHVFTENQPAAALYLAEGFIFEHPHMVKCL